MAPDTEAGVAPCSTVDPRPTLQDLAEAAESVSSSRCVRIKSFSDIPREVIIGLHPGTLVNVSDVRALAVAFNTTATDVAQTLLKHGRELEPGWEQLDAKEANEPLDGTSATIAPGVAEVAAEPNAVASGLSGDDTEAASTADTSAMPANERSDAYELSVGVHELLQQAYTVHRDDLWRSVHGIQDEYMWYQSRVAQLVECMQQFVLCGIGAAVSIMPQARTDVLQEIVGIQLKFGEQRLAMTTMIEEMQRTRAVRYGDLVQQLTHYSTVPSQTRPQQYADVLSHVRDSHRRLAEQHASISSGVGQLRELHVTQCAELKAFTQSIGLLLASQYFGVLRAFGFQPSFGPPQT